MSFQCTLSVISLFSFCVIQSALVGHILLHVFHFEWPCVDSAIVYFSFRLLPSSGCLLALFVALQMFDFIWQVTHLCHFSFLRLKYMAEIRSLIGTTIMSFRWQWNRITFRGHIIEPSHNHQQMKWMCFLQPFTLSFAWTWKWCPIQFHLNWNNALTHSWKRISRDGSQQ